MKADKLTGRLVDSTYQIDEHLAGDARSGRFRGTVTAGVYVGRRVVMTTTVSRSALSSAVADNAQLAGISGVAELLTASQIEEVYPQIVVLVELEPSGKPLATLAKPQSHQTAHQIGRQLCRLALVAERADCVLGGIRPECVYVGEGHSISGIVPRGMSFWADGLPPSYWVNPPFLDCFEPPELLWREPVAATDVYMIAGTVQYLVNGSPPFSGRNWVLQRDASLEEPPLAYRGDAEVGRVLRAALLVAAADRPSLAELEAAFAK